VERPELTLLSLHIGPFRGLQPVLEFAIFRIQFRLRIRGKRRVDACEETRLLDRLPDEMPQPESTTCSAQQVGRAVGAPPLMQAEQTVMTVFGEKIKMFRI
jgi:hypothetical protein